MNTLRKKILSKLREKLHISFISENIMKSNLSDTLDILDELIDENLIEHLGDGYYILKKTKK